MVKESGAQVPRAKRRKTKAERDRQYGSTAANSRVESRNQRGVKSKGKLIRSTEDVQGEPCPNVSMKQCDAGSSAMTANRLTVKLGIFNKGKASTKIQREPLVVPSRIQERTDDDIKRVLDISNGSLSSKSKGDDVSYQSVGGGDGYFAHPLSAKSSYSLQTPDNVSIVETVPSSPPKIQKISQSLPQSPDLEKIATKLVSIIQPSKVFPNRTYFEEVRDDLRRLYRDNNQMEQSVPIHQEIDQKNDLRMMVTSGADDQNHPPLLASIDRQLRETQEHSERSKAANEDYQCSPTNGDAAPEKMEVQKPPEQANAKWQTQDGDIKTSLTQSDDILGENLESGVPMDAKSMLECNEKAMIMLQKQQQHQTERMVTDSHHHPGHEIVGCQAHVGCGSLGWQEPGGYSSISAAPEQEYGIHTDSHGHAPRHCTATTTREHARGVRNAYSALAAQSRTCVFAGSCGSVSHDHSYLPITHQDNLPSHCNRVSSGNAAVITEYNYGVANMSPQKHPHMAYQKPRNQHRDSIPLDLLDMLDHEPGRGLLSGAHDRLYLSQHPLPHMPLHTGLRLEPHESDDSPCWVPRPLTRPLPINNSAESCLSCGQHSFRPRKTLPNLYF